MTPSLYDLLDVEPTASDAEIRAAWKAAIAELDPTDRRFRAYNQAAEVLLDPERRAAYDAELAAAEPGPGPEREEPAMVAAAAPATAATTSVDGGASAASVITDLARKARQRVRKPGPGAGATVAAGRGAVPTWLLVGLAAATLVLIALTAWVWTIPSDDSVEESTRSAQSAAERAIVPVLSYDSTTLDEDQADAQSYLTSDYRSEYDKLFEVIRQNAPATGTKVDVQVIASGIVRSGEDRVEVLLFVNRPTTNKQQSQPVVYKDQVTVTMERVGDDWLVDGMKTSPVAP